MSTEVVSRWHFLHTELQQHEFLIPEDLVIVLSQLADYRARLLPEEAEHLAQMAPVRQIGFASGRHCAHLCQEMLELTIKPVLRRERVPHWPNGVVGSITHSDELACAIASQSLAGVGVDLEMRERLEEKLFDHLFTPWEQAQIRSSGSLAASVMFSAKEAGYKATYSLGKTFIGFKEAEIHLLPENRFSIDYIGPNEVNRVANNGRGYWECVGEHVMSFFVIPNPDI